MTKISMGIALLASLTMACGKKKDDKKGGDAPAGGGAPAAAKACAAGEWAEPSGVFCMKAPAGWTAKPATTEDRATGKQTNIDFTNPTVHDLGISVYFRPTAAIDYESGPKNAETDAKGQGGFEAQGDAPHGKGTYRIYTDPNKHHTCIAFLSAGTNYVHVAFSSYGPNKLPADFLDACKSVYGLDH